MKLQRKSKAPAKTPNWHPSFRLDDRLPDLKVVRTSFFVNVIAATVAAGFLLFTVHREYMAYSLNRDTEAALERIERNSAQNRRYIEMNTEFMQATKKFSELDSFRAVPFRASDLVVALGRTLPQNIDFSAITYDKGQVTLRGSIRGSSDTASTRVSDYLDVLRADPQIGATFTDISLTSLLRDPRTQGLSFEILLKPGEAGKAAGSKA
ncbi:hypothetical protein ASA1KI_12990 [Opitutales bacterium ASA1]|uniref:hypothetical protein n=1 Tax=Congregicoccus parvus TaxID=3081749 RepID=UPI002B2C8D89|nr:hypothetical protein ASA1KI_12990 [Opitutales bacterium ASA1]